MIFVLIICIFARVYEGFFSPVTKLFKLFIYQTEINNNHILRYVLIPLLLSNFLKPVEKIQIFFRWESVPK